MNEPTRDIHRLDHRRIYMCTQTESRNDRSMTETEKVRSEKLQNLGQEIYFRKS
jgi:hypothetical protein